MKRPQFGLRLMLLIVALAATIIGWRTAVNEEHRADRMGERRSLQLTVSQLEKYVENYNEQLKQPDNGWSHQQATMAIKTFEFRIAEMKDRIDQLSK